MMKKIFFILTALFLYHKGYCQESNKDITNEEKIYGLSKVWKEVDKNLPVMKELFSSESTHHGYLKFSEQGSQFTLSDYSFKPMVFKRI